MYMLYYLCSTWYVIMFPIIFGYRIYMIYYNDYICARHHFVFMLVLFPALLIGLVIYVYYIFCIKMADFCCPVKYFHRGNWLRKFFWCVCTKSNSNRIKYSLWKMIESLGRWWFQKISITKTRVVWIQYFLKWERSTRVARFLLVQHTKTENISPNVPKIDQMSIKRINIFHCKTVQNLPKFRLLVWK
jgi:hypothetical protein